MLSNSLSRASAETHSAISVVNAIGTGYGSTIGIYIPCRVEANLGPLIETKRIVTSDVNDKHGLIPKCVDYVERHLHRRFPNDRTLFIKVRSKIPPAVGLKSSSAVSNAVVSAVGKLLLGKESGTIVPKKVLELSCKASKSSGASITGAFDDAIGSLLGGFTLADNRRFRVIRHERVPEELGKVVIIRFPRRHLVYTSAVKIESYSRYKGSSTDAFNLAKEGKIPAAMMLNSIVQCSVLGYSFAPIISACFEGASCAGVSGKGPAIAALCTTSRTAMRIEKRWKEESNELSGLEFIRTLVRQPKELLPSS